MWMTWWQIRRPRRAQQLLMGIVNVLGDACMPIRKFGSTDADMVTNLTQSLRENVEAFDVASLDHLPETHWRFWEWDGCRSAITSSFRPIVWILLEQLKVPTKRLLLADILKFWPNRLDTTWRCCSKNLCRSPGNRDWTGTILSLTSKKN